MKKYEKNYIDTLKRMDFSTLVQYMTVYTEQAVKLQERLSSVILETNLMQKILVEKLKKEKKWIKK